VKSSFAAVFVIVALSLGASVARSADASGSSVFGITIGERLSLPQCPGDGSPGNRYYTGSTRVFCAMIDAPMKRNNGDTEIFAYFPFLGSPAIVKGGTLIIEQRGGVVVAVGFPTPGPNYQDIVFDELQKKYGKPSQLFHQPMQNAFRASYDVMFARWHRGGLSVRFDGSDGTITSGEVEIQTDQHEKIMRDWAAHEEQSAPKL
jgi:hypothetical protein